MVRYFTMLFLLLAYGYPGYAQDGQAVLKGRISSGGQGIPFAAVYTADRSTGTTADRGGHYRMLLSPDSYTLVVQAQGYRQVTVNIELVAGESKTLDFELLEDFLDLEGVVISATRSRVEKRSAPVVVSTIRPDLLTATQSLNLAEGLNYSPGVRLETNCQNCGFTQVRLNGLEGGYTQILVNSRPLFTSLLGVYGLEQIPANTIERVEVVRSGGSALYGSNAIAGTVNIITSDPILNTWEIQSNLGIINGTTLDRQVGVNANVVADDLRSGTTFYGNYRNRDDYDANGDGFTELVTLRNETIGAKSFYKPTDRSRIGANFNAIQEYRRGGDRLELAPQFTDITEEIEHDTFLGGLDFQSDNADYTRSWELYVSGVYTARNSYYGGLGGARTAQDSTLANNAFGNTEDFSWVGGARHTLELGKDVLTLGGEFTRNRTEDRIPGYNRLIDQKVSTAATYVQYEWKPSDRFTALIGGRLDRIDVDGRYVLGDLDRSIQNVSTAFSPRITLNWKWDEHWRYRVGYARGFRAPQAFNEDIHISSVGGEPQFVIISEGLAPEFSDAFTTSLNYSISKGLLQFDALVEGFYTQLRDPFTLVNTGILLDNGSILEEVQNGVGARVFGTNFELGLSPNAQWQLQLGGTIQAADYKEPQLLFESTGNPAEPDIAVDEFVRIPNWYGYMSASWSPSESFGLDVSGSFTGPMTVPRVISDTGFLELNRSPVFADINIRLETHMDISEDFMVTLFGGVKNVFNSFQRDFEVGPERDSDYVYGPALPRSVFLGLKFGRLH